MTATSVKVVAGHLEREGFAEPWAFDSCAEFARSADVARRARLAIVTTIRSPEGPAPAHEKPAAQGLTVRIVPSGVPGHSPADSRGRAAWRHRWYAVKVALASHSCTTSEWPLPRADLDHVLAVAPLQWQEFRGRRVLLTGGTGFVGTWLLASFLWADHEFDLDGHITVLSRAPEAFARRLPVLASDPAVTLVKGDMRSFDLPAPFDFVVHAASQKPLDRSPAAQFARFEADVAGTRRVLDVARRSGASRILFTSSGAVYGPQPAYLAHVGEDYTSGRDLADSLTAYGQAKHVSESLCMSLAAKTDVCCCIARCFAFVGPFLPLDGGYAAGDFLADALRGGPIDVKGDGTPYRSYLHAADLAAWLWTILLRGRSCRPYNVGSDRELTVGQLARRLAHLAGPDAEVRVRKPLPNHPVEPERYVPSIDRARSELGLGVFIDLDDALDRTWSWLRDEKEQQ